MAKFVGFVGTIRGKVGTTVFTKGEKGLTYGRSYQPQIYNPKTVGQVDQRAKMNLVGRMSQITPKGLLVGMNGVNNRQRRSRFNSVLLSAALIDRTDPANIMAKIEPGNIIFSQGAEIIAASAGTPSVTSRMVTVALTLSDAALAGSYGERIVVTVVDPSSKGGYSTVRYSDVVLDGVAATTVSVPFPSAIEGQSLVCVYRIPFVLNESGISYRTESIRNDGTDIIANMLANPAAYVRGFGSSVLLSSSVFTAA